MIGIKDRLRQTRDRIVGLTWRLEEIELRQKEFARRQDDHVRRLDSHLKRLARQLRDIELNVQALIRLSLPADDLPYPQRLALRRFSIRSQNHEDGITLVLLEETGTVSGRFAELGCGENGGNSGFLANELGWSGLMVDADPSRLALLRAAVSSERVATVETWLDRDNVNGILASHGLEGDVELISIDVDGNDYWLWGAIEVCSPRLVIIEYNSIFGPDRAVVVPYDAGFRRRSFEGMKGTYYGASLQALVNLGARKGYRLVAVEPRGVNAFFLRHDVAPHIPRCDPRAEYRFLDGYAALQASGFDFWARLEQRSLPLVDVGGHGDGTSLPTMAAPVSFSSDGSPSRRKPV